MHILACYISFIQVFSVATVSIYISTYAITDRVCYAAVLKKSDCLKSDCCIRVGRLILW